MFADISLYILESMIYQMIRLPLTMSDSKLPQTLLFCKFWSALLVLIAGE